MSRTVVHLSDLHFGRIDPEIPPALTRAVIAAAPDLVTVSGDFTQRARIAEFEAASAFLKTLPTPVLAIPGNHDVPLYNVIRRWLAPFDRYRHYIANDLAPFWADAEIAVLGVNTARSLTFKGGRINRSQMEAARLRFAECGKDLTRIVVTHHTFDTPRADRASKGHAVVGRAAMAMVVFLQAEIDMILSGHLHTSSVNQTVERYPLPGRPALLICAGTAASTRKRGQENAFNIIRVDRPQVTVDLMVWRDGQGNFSNASTERFTRTESGWSRLALS